MAKGLCRTHYYQQRRGKDLTPIRGSDWSKIEFWNRVDQSGDCWVWEGSVLNSGYGACSIDGDSWLVHRYSYTLANGPIPEGLTIDHMCRNRLCVHPDHLRAMTTRANTRAQGLRPNNTSGYRGVSWDKSRQKWAAQVKVAGKSVWSGRFDRLEDAAEAVQAARDRIYREHP